MTYKKHWILAGILSFVCFANVSAADCKNVLECSQLALRAAEAAQEAVVSLKEENLLLKTQLEAHEKDSKHDKSTTHFDSGWFAFKTGQSTAITHGLGQIPHGYTILISQNKTSAILSDVWQFENQGGKGVGLTDINNKNFTVRAGSTNLLDTYSLAGQRVLIDSGFVRVIAWTNTK